VPKKTPKTAPYEKIHQRDSASSGHEDPEYGFLPIRIVHRPHFFSEEEEETVNEWMTSATKKIIAQVLTP